MRKKNGAVTLQDAARLWIPRVGARRTSESLGRELVNLARIPVPASHFRGGQKFFFECCFESTAPPATFASVPPLLVPGSRHRSECEFNAAQKARFHRCFRAVGVFFEQTFASATDLVSAY